MMEYRGGGPLHVPRFELPDARVGGQKFHLLDGDLIPSGEPRRLGRFSPDEKGIEILESGKADQLQQSQ